MTTVPYDFTSVPLGNYQSGQKARANEWKALVGNQHLRYARHDARFAGVVWDPPWYTTSTTFVTEADDAFRRPLDSYLGAGRLLRPAKGDVVKLTIAVYLETAIFQYYVHRRNADGTRTQLASDTGDDAGPAWAFWTEAFTAAEVSDQGNADNTRVPLELTAEACTLSGETGYLYELHAWAKILTGSELPY